jgi:hypothetical protein
MPRPPTFAPFGQGPQLCAALRPRSGISGEWLRPVGKFSLVAYRTYLTKQRLRPRSYVRRPPEMAGHDVPQLYSILFTH